MQKTKLRMWSSSYAIRLPKTLIKAASLRDGSTSQV